MNNLRFYLNRRYSCTALLECVMHRFLYGTKALAYSKESGQINNVEFQILQISINKQVFQSSDLKELFVGKHSAEISRNIKRLRDKNLITSEKENSRKYLINFQNKILLRGIIRALDDNGFLPIMNE
ncbi:MAG: hypothetical protein P8O94_03360 [Flavobacteriaceae bacterium]|nr:hypothetical protein [Flavobacteriaceae bacterium]MDG1091906.1 hypothetical protein [Flavobacteriaceae bacterium]